MADIRALLRSELASRTPASSKHGKKRKFEPLPTETQKKRRLSEEATQTGVVDNGTERPLSNREESESAPEAMAANSEVIKPQLPVAVASELPVPTPIDEDEWAAFERDVVAPTKIPVNPAVSTLISSATISAAPVSASELAQQEREERESRTKAREAQLEGEKEEATKSLEDEFDEMEQLDERVNRLKEKREEILRRRQEILRQGDTNIEDPRGQARERAEDKNDSEDEEEIDDLDEEWDDWQFR